MNTYIREFSDQFYKSYRSGFQMQDFEGNMLRSDILQDKDIATSLYFPLLEFRTLQPLV